MIPLSKDMYAKAKKALGDDDITASIALYNVFKNGFDWASRITDDDIKAAEEREKQKDKEAEEKNARIQAENARIISEEGKLPDDTAIGYYRMDRGMEPLILEICKDLAEALDKDTDNWMLFVFKTHVLRPYARTK